MICKVSTYVEYVESYLKSHIAAMITTLILINAYSRYDITNRPVTKQLITPGWLLLMVGAAEATHSYNKNNNILLKDRQGVSRRYGAFRHMYIHNYGSWISILYLL